MDALPQHDQTDLAYDLSGVEASWQGTSGESWAGWLPHLDLAVSRAFTAGSAMHEELWAKLRQPGKLRLKTKLNLWQMLRPAVQPGSRIDYEWPAEQVTVTLRSNSPFELIHAGRSIASSPDEKRGHAAAITVKPASDIPIPVEVVLATGDDRRLSVEYRTQESVRWRPLPLHRMLLPWAPATTGTAKIEAPREIPELAGGNWARGRRVFFGQEAGCAKCHLMGGEGSRIGPDLSNLPHRDYHSVLRDIATPSYAINPDYVTSNVQLRDGRALVGVLRTVGDKIEIGDKDGRVVTVGREEIEKLRASPLSIMPEGFGKQISPEKTRDLMTFLLTEPPRMPDYGPSRPPPARSRREVERVLAGAPSSAGKTRPLRIALVAGRKDHGPGEHDYPAWLTVWPRLLSMAEETTASTAMEWPSADDLKTADVLVFYQQGRWTPERAKDIDAFLARGGGLVYVHYAVDGGADAPGFAQRIGLAWRGGQSKFRHGPLDLDFSPAADHPLARNFDKVHFHDESYWQLAGDASRIRLLASGKEDGRSQPLFWTLEHAKGRVFVSILGHYSWTFDDPLFRILLLRGIAWSAREPVDRFNELATPGARVE
jgi:putative heme-binding domain-containing protein